jgi:Uma2 family endonuclease
MSIVTAKWSLQDYHQMIDTGLLDDRKVELLRGEIIEMSPEGVPHSFSCRETGEYLRQLLVNRARISEAHPITLPNNSEPEPDIAILRLPAALYRNRHPQPEDIFWLIEVSNATLVKDLTIKKDLYADAGISEYWVMNLPESVLVVFRDLTASGYQSETRLQTGTIYPLTFPDISIDVQKLFAGI